MAQGRRRGGSEPRRRRDMHEQSRVREGESEVVVVSQEGIVTLSRRVKPVHLNLCNHLPPGSSSHPVKEGEVHFRRGLFPLHTHVLDWISDKLLLLLPQNYYAVVSHRF